jgi:hypothetical protein
MGMALQVGAGMDGIRKLNCSSIFAAQQLLMAN